MTTCNITGCTRPRFARGWCSTHYSRWARTGSTTRRLTVNVGSTCTECDRPAGSKGLCGTHYERVRRNGDLALRRARNSESYAAIHMRIKRTRGPASAHPCIDCGGPAQQWSYDHADPDERTSPVGPYSLDPDRYQPRCCSCHTRFDKTR